MSRFYPTADPAGRGRRRGRFLLSLAWAGHLHELHSVLDIDLTMTPSTRRLFGEVRAFMAGEVLPRHAGYVETLQRSDAPPAGMADLRARARSAGLWSLARYPSFPLSRRPASLRTSSSSRISPVPPTLAVPSTSCSGSAIPTLTSTGAIPASSCPPPHPGSASVERTGTWVCSTPWHRSARSTTTMSMCRRGTSLVRRAPASSWHRCGSDRPASTTASACSAHASR